MKKKNSSSNHPFKPIMIIALFFAVIIIAIFIGDLLNLADTLNIHMRYDWAAIFCAFMSAVSAITLGIVSIKQNNRLSELNEKSLEVSKINNGYSLIHFREKQPIRSGGKLLKLKLYDTKNIPLDYIVVNRIAIKPLKAKYEESDKPEILLTSQKQKLDLEFTPINPENPVDFYYANVEIDSPQDALKGNSFVRLDLNITVVNTLGIATSYDYFIMALVDNRANNDVDLCNYYEYNYCRGIKAI